MALEAAEVLREALTLPAEARAALVDSLIESLDSGIDEGAEAAWCKGIRQRLREIDPGAVDLVPWEEARVRLHGLQAR
jgi:hypothetical protein